MSPERCITEAMIRALTWKDERIASELGMIRFTDFGGARLFAYLGGEGEDGAAFEVIITVKRRT